MLLVIEFLGYFIRIYSYIILAYVLIGYFPDARGSKIYQLLENLCRPLLNLFSFATVSGVSFAPILSILFLELIRYILIMLY